MPISPVGKGDSRLPARGFTLIELLVVVAIIAILSLGVGLSAGGIFARPGAVSAAERLVQADQRARDRALLGRGTLGLVPGDGGWAVARRTGTAWQAEGPALTLGASRLTWEVAGRPYLPGLNGPREEVPPVQIAPDGGSTPYAVTILTGSQRRICRAPAGGPLACE
ncbi:GspH/FimT family pseudopilin [Pararhodobacter aggregans]|uniref:Type II secretion system protein H n=1 Tax=Pararhodobacter aggregans TaxID=404875 RepID=A0A2T7UNL7_9RHOB|nr:GspH/FimT family pseudopilin [Pararhodobacter aggregans]PTX00722.1 prepilin-type N-terminal cleavage/methylation domain-containing protein [Pararhodobacter aggregans]PVE46257.1 hypothetical protein DDE23_16555 [Pararhodobacter aggregans]